jgi:hypothetical protein
MDTEIIIIPEGHRLCRGCFKNPECKQVIPYVKMRVRCSECYFIYRDTKVKDLEPNTDGEDEAPTSS